MAHTTDAGPTSGTAVTALRVTAGLTVLTIVWQFVTAGQLFAPGADDVEGLHAAGALVLHVVAALATIAAVLVWRAGAALWPAVVAGLVFVLSFVQAQFGARSTLYVHVPGAMILTVGAVWVLAWSLTRGPLARTR